MAVLCGGYKAEWFCKAFECLAVVRLPFMMVNGGFNHAFVSCLDQLL